MMHRTIIVASLIFLISVSPVFAGWQTDIATNQQMALNYISELQYKVNPTRPKFIINNGWQSKRALNEILSAVERAEEMAKAGRQDLIVLPLFQY